MKTKYLFIASAFALLLASCAGSTPSTMAGGELTGAGSQQFSEPAPFGMVLIQRGSLKLGEEETDSLWGSSAPYREISVESFWMDDTEITNAEYKQFICWVRDSIIRERLADPAFGGDETYKIEEDKDGEPLDKPYLNWKKAIPWRKPNEDQKIAIESIYRTNPITGKKELDVDQLNYRYEVYDYAQAALRKNQLDPTKRVRNTDTKVNPDEVIMISKDTAYFDDEGRIVRETINRPRSGPWDFLNTYIINIFPDTTTWVNDFPNAQNEMYMQLYFNHPNYNDYPVVGVSWEQANAFCAWRTDYLLRGLGPQAKYIQRYRLPTEAEWEFAARGKEGTLFPWLSDGTHSDEGCFYANFKPEKGNYTKDGSLITTKVGSYEANSNGLFDMAGNVAEWTSTVYTDAGVLQMSDINPELYYNAAPEDPYSMKKKTIRGGSWKDPERFIQSVSRGYEYQNESRSYIGFRCVRSYVGTNKKTR